ncbi:MAG TPA: hypothetical protein VL614_19655 [Acetobacteraceae bacterium]|jgi:hypothetical protein|nr:hypothetical protein [Acetobacteraceae bacterium]
MWAEVHDPRLVRRTSATALRQTGASALIPSSNIPSPPHLKGYIVKTGLIAAASFIAALGVAHAENACDAEIQKTTSDWQAIALQPASKPGQISKGVSGHAHIQSAVDSMRFHLAEAKSLCKQGKDHDALLHLDVVRAFLNLPEIQHPTDHRYLFKSG